MTNARYPLTRLEQELYRMERVHCSIQRMIYLIASMVRCINITFVIPVDSSKTLQVHYIDRRPQRRRAAPRRLWANFPPLYRYLAPAPIGVEGDHGARLPATSLPVIPQSSPDSETAVSPSRWFTMSLTLSYYASTDIFHSRNSEPEFTKNSFNRKAFRFPPLLP